MRLEQEQLHRHNLVHNKNKNNNNNNFRCSIFLLFKDKISLGLLTLFEGFNRITPLKS